MVAHPTILAIGAAGPAAGLVVPELARRGAVVRGLVRDEAQGPAVLAHGAAEIAVGDLRERASLDAAMRGVDAVFYLAPAFMEHEAAVGVGVVEAAKAAGVRRLVFSSVIHPVLSGLVNHAAKAPVEEAVLDSGMEYTFLHPTLFFQNFAPGWQKMVETGRYAEPWSAETRFTRVDYRDVAEVAAIALTEDRLLFGTFELCADGNLDRQGVAALMSDVLGRPIEAASLGADEIAHASGTAPGAPPTPIQRMFTHYDHHDLLGNALTLRAILGREPRTLRAFFEELAATER